MQLSSSVVNRTLRCRIVVHRGLVYPRTQNAVQFCGISRSFSEFAKLRHLKYGKADSESHDMQEGSTVTRIFISEEHSIRNKSWKISEPEIRYDHALLRKKLLYKPSVWLTRNIKVIVPLTMFVSKILLDMVRSKEVENRKIRAAELLKIFSGLSPALIKAGQSLSSRSDLLPAEYLNALRQLQDRCPPFPTEEAVALFQKEMKIRFDDVFVLDFPEPVAAASIGQVYKGRLKSNNLKVAIKIQRPNCEESVAVDLFILRIYAELLQNAASLLGRSLDLTSIIDDFGVLLYRELDYRAEAASAQRFAALYGVAPDVFVPKIYPGLSSSKVLVMEWADGVRLDNSQAIKDMGFENSHFIHSLVQCTMRQMLENGFFHADPHAGNLLAMASGKLCYLDFGMVSYVEPAQRYMIIEAVVHLVNRDFRALALLYRRMGFIPEDVNIDPIVLALENALPDVLNSGVGEFNFSKVFSRLGDVMYKFPFSLPPYYIAIIRCLGVLEGLAIQVDKDFRILRVAYPYIASRLLSDPSAELQAALLQLLFVQDRLRYDRLLTLVQEATQVSDYNIANSVDLCISYLGNRNSEALRSLLAVEIVNSLDALETETLQLLLHTLQNNPFSGPTALAKAMLHSRGNLHAALNELVDRVTAEIEHSTAEDAHLRHVARSVAILRASKGAGVINPFTVASKIHNEPVLTAWIAHIASELTGRLAAKTARRVLGQESVMSVMAASDGHKD